MMAKVFSLVSKSKTVVWKNYIAGEITAHVENIFRKNIKRTPDSVAESGHAKNKEAYDKDKSKSLRNEKFDVCKMIYSNFQK